MPFSNPANERTASTGPAPSLPPIYIERVFDEPGIIRALVERHAPYSPVQRYFQSDAEYDAASGRRNDSGAVLVAPNFRGDWAYDVPLVEGARPILEHSVFVDAAAELFGSARVRPQAVYSNLTWQLPFDQGRGHTDVPAFRGIDRTAHPIWLLNAMGHSGLFEEERIRIATAVAWFYEGTDGGFCYWPDGPDAPPRVHEGAIHNTAIMGDNDRMYHRVRPVGRREDGMLTRMTLDTRLEHEGSSRFRIVEGDAVLARFPFEELRISVSWKARVFRDAEEEHRVAEHRDDLALDEVLDRFGADLARRGVDYAPPADPLRDPGFVEVLARTYVRMPTISD